MKKPNLLFIYTDEQRFDTLNCYGNKTLAMPNLNRLAERSTVFERAYVTQPVCTPSRATLLTGLTPHSCQMTTNNLTLPDDIKCLPEYLSEDYICAHHGKWHLGDEIFPQHGFTEWLATEDTYHAFYSPERDQSARSGFHHFLRSQGVNYHNRSDLPEEIRTRFFRNQIGRLPEELSRPAYLGNTASRFLRDRSDDGKPFALYVNFLEPHMPFYSCRDGQYAPQDVEISPNFMHDLPEDAPRRLRAHVAKYRQGFDVDRPLETEDQWRRLYARYWGMCSLIDTHAGRILRTLEECGLDENTIVVFTSDHGDMMGSHRLLGKGTMYEEAARVPLLIHLPGQSEQRRIKGPASQLDLVPTLLDAMDVTVPEGLEGRSRLAAVKDGAECLDDDVFIEWHGSATGRQPVNMQEAAKLQTAVDDKSAQVECIRTVVTSNGWKLNVSSLGDDELYHLVSDPYEMNNLIADPAQQALKLELLEKLRQRQRTTADELMELPEVI